MVLYMHLHVQNEGIHCNSYALHIVLLTMTLKNFVLSFVVEYVKKYMSLERECFVYIHCGLITCSGAGYCQLKHRHIH